MAGFGERPEDANVQSILARVVELYRPERVYLFGSRARGDHRDDSDFDLLAVLPDDADEERLRSRRFYENCWDLPRSADVLIWRRTSFDAQAARVVASLPATVLREGRLLYAA
jgi:predicted nucleotidyltransferase